MPESRIVVTGSLDMATVPQLTQVVADASREHERVILDVANLEFVDSTGVRTLITLRQQLEKEGRTLACEGFRQEILDILDILGVRELIVGAAS